MKYFSNIMKHLKIINTSVKMIAIVTKNVFFIISEALYYSTGQQNPGVEVSRHQRRY